MSDNRVRIESDIGIDNDMRVVIECGGRERM